ncbi:hypothetical protein Q9L58_009945 [Maublancomyces gigas]|uniref:Uncharacterized protein n=1 Tax=Discina gigas TaxID=1032678 RepID=A0ABR3G5V3_9PEZI
MQLCLKKQSAPASPIAKGKKRSTEAEVGPERGRGIRPDEILSLEAQIILAMGRAGKAWSALRFEISTICVGEDMTGRKACGAKKWAALEGLADAQMVERFDDFWGDGGGSVATGRDVERICLRVAITDPDTIAALFLGQSHAVTPDMTGCQWALSKTGRTPIGKSRGKGKVLEKGNGKSAEKGKVKAVEKGREGGEKRKTVSKPEQDDSDEEVDEADDDKLM